MKTFTTLILTVFLNCIYSQNTDCQLDVGSIKQVITDTSSENYYDSLLNRFSNFDSTLSAYQYKLLYYGNYFYKNYSPYSIDKHAKKFWKSLENNAYQEAIEYGKKSLELNPINLRLIYFMSLVNLRIENNEDMRKYTRYQYFPLIDVIHNSCSNDTSKFVVISVFDEYEILRDLEVQKKKQYLINLTDVLELEDNELKIKKLYFDVSLPQMYLMNESRKGRREKKRNNKKN